MARVSREVRAGLLGAILALLAVVFSGSSAQITPGSLSADHSVVAACDAAIGLAWTDGASAPTYSGSPTVGSSTFLVESLRLLDVDPSCDGQLFELTIADGTGAALVDLGGLLSVTAGTATLTFPPTDTGSIDRTFVVIHS